MVALVLLAWVLFNATALYSPDALARVAFPWADNEWGDGPILIQLHRLYLGQPAYVNSVLATSFDYGPVYVFVLFAVAKVTGAPFGIVTFRAISVALGLLSAIPFAACAMLIARRFGVPLTRGLTTLVVIASVLLTLALVSRDITFASLHPDALVALLTATVLAVYYAIATRRLNPRFVWALLTVSAVAALTKQNSVLVFPLLVAALAVTGVIRWRLAIATVAVFAGVIVAAFALMSPDMRAWTLLIPQAHGYEFTRSGRAAGLLQYLFSWQYYITAEVVMVALVSALIQRREGWRAYVTDGAPLLAIAAVAILGYFKVLGVWNNLSLLALFAAPYCAALIVPLVTARSVVRTPWAWTLGAAVMLAAVAIGIDASEAPGVASSEMRSQMADVQVAMRALCAERAPILALTMTDMFLDCPNARLFPMLAYLEEENARNGFSPGLFALDRPPAFPRVVDMQLFPIPRRWQRFYRLVKSYPAVFGFGNYYYVQRVRVWALR